MPPLNTINILAQLKFASHQLKLGTKKAGKGAKEGHSDKYEKDRDKSNDPTVTPTVMPPMFTPQVAGNPYHLDSCNKIGQNWIDFMNSMLDAVKFAHTMWKMQAKFKDLQVMAVSAIGSPGCLDGPDLDIKGAPMVASMSGNAAKLRDAVHKGVSKCFKNWQGQVTIPGLPFYPAFAAFPGPMAPPMPNVPVPLIACVSGKMTDITVPGTMKDAMVDALDSEIKDKDPEKQYEAAFDGIDAVLSLAFLMWLPSQMVMLVLGKGPIPTFAPPYVPVGPVVGGDNIAIPGHLMA